jgi:hypothetical protein
VALEHQVTGFTKNSWEVKAAEASIVTVLDWLSFNPGLISILFPILVWIVLILGKCL